MTRCIIFITLLFGLFACGQNSNNKKSDTRTIKQIVMTKEEWTIYSKQDTIVRVKRLLSSATGLTLLSYDINISEPEVAKQTFISSKPFSNKNEIDNIKEENASFNWEPYPTTLTLFVQISGKAFKYDLEPWDKREEILNQIEKALKLQGHAEEIGDDIGPGGLNMLFECEKIDDAVPAILNILKKYGYDNETIIGRHINTEAEDWFYEVVYPQTFNGVFLTM
jgi:hypothetical protein